MERQEYFRSTSGRLFSATAAFALVAAGILALAEAGAHGVAVPLIVLACVVGSILAIGLSVERFPGVASALVLVLPPVGGMYFAALTVIGGLGMVVGVPALALGLVATWVAVRGGSGERRTAARHAATARAHAH